MRLLLLLVVSACTACASIQSLTIEVLQSPERDLSIPPENVLVVNRCLRNDDDNHLTLLEEDEVFTGNSVSRECVAGLLQAMAASPANNIDSLMVPVHEITSDLHGKIQEPLRKYMIDSLGRNYGKDHIIVVEFVGVGMYHEYELLSQYDPLSNETYYYYDIVSVNYCPSGYIRIYSLADSLVIAEFSSTDTLGWSDRPQENKEMVEEAAYWCGYYLANRFMPQWMAVDRVYYASGKKGFRVAHLLAQQDEWLEAARYWNMLSNHRNKTVASRACFNLALTSEINDDIPLAIMWADKSLALRKTALAKSYLDVLRQRLADRNKSVWLNNG